MFSLVLYNILLLYTFYPKGAAKEQKKLFLNIHIFHNTIISIHNLIDRDKERKYCFCHLYFQMRSITIKKLSNSSSLLHFYSKDNSLNVDMTPRRIFATHLHGVLSFFAFTVSESLIRNAKICLTCVVVYVVCCMQHTINYKQQAGCDTSVPWRY